MKEKEKIVVDKNIPTDNKKDKKTRINERFLTRLWHYYQNHETRLN